MIPSTLCTLVAILSSLAAANGAVAQRDGPFHIRQANPATTTTTSTLSSHSSSTSATQSTTASTTPSTTATSTTSTLTLMTTSTPSTASATSTLSSSATSAPSTSPTVIATSPTVTATIPVTKSSTTTVTATATSTAAPGAVDCNGVQTWQAAFAYSAGDQVIFNGQLFKARQWTYNNAPPTHSDQWTAVGACTQPINNQANCNGVAAWQSIVAYTTGNRVTFQGHLWSAVQWAESNAPGDTSGSWKDLGACA